MYTHAHTHIVRQTRESDPPSASSLSKCPRWLGLDQAEASKVEIYPVSRVGEK